VKQNWFIKTMVWLIVASLFNGCAGYRLGTSLPRDIRSIYIPMFINRTGEPMIEARATNATIAEFQKDGTLRIFSDETSDVTIEVTLTKLDLSPLQYSKTDKRKPNEYRLRLYASYVLRRTASREILAQEQDLIGESTFIFAGNLTTAKQGAIPNAAEDLGKSIVESVVEYW